MKNILNKIEREKITDELLLNLIKTNEKIYIDDFTNIIIAQEIGLNTQKPIKQTLRGDKITHTLKRHGKDSNMVKYGGQIPTDLEDIKNYVDIVNNANLYSIKFSNGTGKILLSGVQINGFYVVAESVCTNKNELKFISYYKENGTLARNKDFDGKHSGVRVLTPDGRPYSPKSSLGVKLDSSPRSNENISQQNLKNAESDNVDNLSINASESHKYRKDKQ